MTTVRELYDQAVKVGAEDFEIVFSEEADFVFVSKMEIDLAKEEVRLT